MRYMQQQRRAVRRPGDEWEQSWPVPGTTLETDAQKYLEDIDEALAETDS